MPNPKPLVHRYKNVVDNTKKCTYPIGDTHTPKEYRHLQTLFRANKLLAYNEAYLSATYPERQELELAYLEYRERLKLCPISFLVQGEQNANRVETLIKKEGTL